MYRDCGCHQGSRSCSASMSHTPFNETVQPIFEVGVSPEHLKTSAVKCGFRILASSLETKSSLARHAMRKRTTNETASSVPASKKKRPENRKGTKVIEDRKDFPKLSPDEKLEFMVRYASADPGTYQNSDRTWIYRAQRIIRCYRTCHGENKESFLSLHRNNKGGFEYSKVADRISKGCPNCKTIH